MQQLASETTKDKNDKISSVQMSPVTTEKYKETSPASVAYARLEVLQAEVQPVPTTAAAAGAMLALTAAAIALENHMTRKQMSEDKNPQSVDVRPTPPDPRARTSLSKTLHSPLKNVGMATRRPTTPAMQPQIKPTMEPPMAAAAAVKPEQARVEKPTPHCCESNPATAPHFCVQLVSASPVKAAHVVFASSAYILAVLWQSVHVSPLVDTEPEEGTQYVPAPHEPLELPPGHALALVLKQ